MGTTGLLLATVLQGGNVYAQAPVSGIEYDVTFDVASAANRSLGVAMSFDVAGDEAVALSLPAWTPGSYELDDYARFVYAFRATQGDAEIRWDKADFDTWRVYPIRAGRVTVAFDYRAVVQDVGSSWSAPDFAFFNGTNILPFPEGQGLEFESRLRVHTEDDWSVATGLTHEGEGFTYGADSYHELVDMPTFVGRFQLDSTRIDGRWYRLATYPEGVLDGAARNLTWRQIRAMLPPMVEVFDETPWSDYTTLLVFTPQSGGGSALEHANSHLGVYGNVFIGTSVLASITAHEIFHAWNVKRLRPADLWPYDYDEPQPTELLWVSEGITDYYADLALVRGGIVEAEEFYATTHGKMSNVWNVPAVALEDASLSTWISPVDGTGSIYYPKGSLVGFLLDILIRDASDNERSLDDALGALYERTYGRGQGFTEADFWDEVSRAAGRSFESFHDRYVDGREPLPWDEVLPLAGMELRRTAERVPRIGVSTSSTPDGARVTDVVEGSSADLAGVRVGDLLLEVGGVDASEGAFGARFRARYAGAEEGAPYTIEVNRRGRSLRLAASLGFAERVSTELGPVPDPSAKARRIRDGILGR